MRLGGAGHGQISACVELKAFQARLDSSAHRCIGTHLMKVVTVTPNTFRGGEGVGGPLLRSPYICP